MSSTAHAKARVSGRWWRRSWCWTPFSLDSVITAVGMVDHRR